MNFPGTVKVLIDHTSPFFLAHGGLQVQIEQTKKALEEQQIEVEWLRWWDPNQKGDVIHVFGLVSRSYQHFARLKGIPVISTFLLTEPCNRSSLHLSIQGAFTRGLLASPLGGKIRQISWWGHLLATETIIVTLEAEKMVLTKVYGYPAENVHVVPIGCEDVFLQTPPSSRTGDYLVCSATITERKRNVELAEMAIAAKVPVLFIGNGYGGADDPYWKRFKALAESSPYVRHQPHTNDRAELAHFLQNARGFVLFSKYENWCIAADEAIACGLPVLLVKQRWALERFSGAKHWLVENDPPQNIATLEDFYHAAPNLPLPPRPISWKGVAENLESIYRSKLESLRKGKSR